MSRLFNVDSCTFEHLTYGFGFASRRKTRRQAVVITHESLRARQGKIAGRYAAEGHPQAKGSAS